MRRMRAAGIRGEPITVVVQPGVYPMEEPVDIPPRGLGRSWGPRHL